MGEPEPIAGDQLFDGLASFAVTEDNRPAVRLVPSDKTGRRLLAHTKVGNVTVEGPLEPVVGREWRSYATENRFAGQYVAYEDVCYAPGGQISQETTFAVGRFGIWQAR